MSDPIDEVLPPQIIDDTGVFTASNGTAERVPKFLEPGIYCGICGARVADAWSTDDCTLDTEASKAHDAEHERRDYVEVQRDSIRVRYCPPGDPRVAKPAPSDPA